MAAMKPRTGDGPLEVTKEGRGIVMRVPLEGGGRLVVEMTPEEADTLSEELKNLNGLPADPSIKIPYEAPAAGISTRCRGRFAARERFIPSYLQGSSFGTLVTIDGH